MARMNISITQARLSHSTILAALETWSHVLPGLRRETDLRFDSPLAAAPKGADEFLRDTITLPCRRRPG